MDYATSTVAIGYLVFQETESSCGIASRSRNDSGLQQDTVDVIDSAVVC
jgi:hypothetical protein